MCFSIHLAKHCRPTMIRFYQTLNMKNYYFTGRLADGAKAIVTVLYLITACVHARADTYPVELQGAWGSNDLYGHTSIDVARANCRAYEINQQNPIVNIGKKHGGADLLIFRGNVVSNFNEFAKKSDINSSIQRLSQNRWRIIDKHYGFDEKGDTKNWHNVPYEVSLTASDSGIVMTIARKQRVDEITDTFTYQYLKCTTTKSSTPELGSDCILATPGQGFPLGDSKIIITKEAFDINTDVETKIKQLLGSQVKLVEWQVLKTLLSTNGQLTEFIRGVGIPQQLANGPCDNFLVTNGGQLRTSDGHRTFIARHDGKVPENWLVLDSVGDHTLDLGRWSYKSQALVIIDNRGEVASDSSTLIIGYPNEGKVDATLDRCSKTVTSMTAWSGSDLKEGIAKVCAARNRHLAAYERLQSDYRLFAATVTTDRRLNLTVSANHLKAFIKSCMDQKFAITTGGHNILLDIIPNEIAADCLNLGAELLEGDTARLTCQPDPLVGCWH